MTFGMLGEPATLDPYSPLASDLTYALVRPVYPSLFRFLPDGSTEPYLASSVDASEGRAVVELADALWSNGRPITSDDVVASARRAHSPSGFARLDSIEAISPTLLRLEGNVDDWERTLATLTWVLPGGKPRAASGISGGPFRMKRVTPGLEVVFEPNPRLWGTNVELSRVTVQFIESVEIMLALLEQDRLDAAAVPWTINLDERLDALGLSHARRIGNEMVFLDGAGLDQGRSAAFAAIDVRALERGFVRSGGRPPAGGKPLPATESLPGALLLGTARGDELLELMSRAVQRDLRAAGTSSVNLAEIDVRTFYGSWDADDEGDLDLRREMAIPGGLAVEMRTGEALPVARVATTLAWSSGIDRLEPNPSFEGPLWNMEVWGFAP